MLALDKGGHPKIIVTLQQGLKKKAWHFRKFTSSISSTLGAHNKFIESKHACQSRCTWRISMSIHVNPKPSRLIWRPTSNK